jgi:hypothetical protein
MSIKVSPEAFRAAYSDYIVIVGITEADLAILVGAGLATKPSHSPITYQQNPPSPPQASKPPQSLIPRFGLSGLRKMSR